MVIGSCSLCWTAVDGSVAWGWWEVVDGVLVSFDKFHVDGMDGDNVDIKSGKENVKLIKMAVM